MIVPDFSQYTLALIYEERMVFSSNQQGLTPLMICLQTYEACLKGCVLFDKVIGLAAAKLISRSKLIASVRTMVISEPALAFLRGQHIDTTADRVVDNILTRDRLSVCPGEVIALKNDDDASFLRDIKSMIQRV